MSSETESTVQLKQGAQLKHHGARIGLMRVGAPGGVPTAKLSVRTASSTDVVDLQLGESAPCGEYGSVTLVDVVAPNAEATRGAAMLRLDA